MSIFLKAFKKSVDTKLKCIDQGFSGLEEMGNKISASIRAGGKLFCVEMVAQLLMRNTWPRSYW